MFKTANNDSISRPNSRPKLPFPGNGKGKFKMPREGKAREIWGLYSRESRETGIPVHPWGRITYIYYLGTFDQPSQVVDKEVDAAVDRQEEIGEQG